MGFEVPKQVRLDGASYQNGTLEMGAGFVFEKAEADVKVRIKDVNPKIGAGAAQLLEGLHEASADGVINIDEMLGPIIKAGSAALAGNS